MKEELKHHGVLGMKWGRGKQPRPMSEDAKKAKELKKKKVSEMSNSELKRLNERMNLEQNYKRLNPNTVKKGTAYLGSAVVTTGSILALYNNSGRLIKLGKKCLYPFT